MGVIENAEAMQLLDEFNADVQFECGWTDLVWQMAEIAPPREFQNYVSLIRQNI